MFYDDDDDDGEGLMCKMPLKSVAVLIFSFKK